MTARTDREYFDDLTVHLRLAELTGREIGAMLEEARAHLADSGQTAEDAFGPVDEYAQEIIASRGGEPADRSGLGRGDLLAGAAMIIGWFLLVHGVLAAVDGEDVAILPGHLLGTAILVAAFGWVVWPVVSAYLMRRLHVVVLVAVLLLAPAATIAPAVLWTEPELVTIPAAVAIVAAVAIIAGLWWRILRRATRDRIRRPTER